jgi:hypothetical protein
MERCSLEVGAAVKGYNFSDCANMGASIWCGWFW